MSFNFALLYLQLEDMQKRARSQGGIAYIKQEYHVKIQKIMNIIAFTYIGIFMVVQLVVLGLTVTTVIEPD